MADVAAVCQRCHSFAAGLAAQDEGDDERGNQRGNDDHGGRARDFVDAEGEKRVAHHAGQHSVDVISSTTSADVGGAPGSVGSADTISGMQLYVGLMVTGLFSFVGALILVAVFRDRGGVPQNSGRWWLVVLMGCGGGSLFAMGAAKWLSSVL